MDYLKTSPFSISIDEGTDKMGESYLAISARCFTSTAQNSPEERFLGLFEVRTSSKGEDLYKKITDLLFSGANQEFIKQNFMGVCSDHGTNMISEGEAGVQERLKRDFPYIFAVHDYAHVFNLVMEKAMSKFPANILSLIRKICSSFSKSSQKKAKFIEIQETMELKPLRVLKYVDTRWSSLYYSVDRILTLHVPLQVYFDQYGGSMQNDSLNESNILYLQLLECLLKKLNDYCIFFQREDLNTTSRECLIFMGEYVVAVPSTEVTTQAFQESFKKIYEIPFHDKNMYEIL